MLAPIRQKAPSRASFLLEGWDEVAFKKGFLAAELPLKICAGMTVSPMSVGGTLKRVNGQENSDKRHKEVYVGGCERSLV
jgi:hypothetical protein